MLHQLTKIMNHWRTQENAAIVFKLHLLPDERKHVWMMDCGNQYNNIYISIYRYISNQYEKQTNIKIICCSWWHIVLLLAIQNSFYIDMISIHVLEISSTKYRYETFSCVRVKMGKCKVNENNECENCMNRFLGKS